MNTVDQLGELFARFPGIGPRQAKRFVYHILQADSGYVNDLVSKISNLREITKQCGLCYRYFIPKSGTPENCELCLSPLERETMVVVEKDVDLENVRRSGAHKGYYFVLGGLLPILEENPESRIRINELKERLRKEDSIGEVILALAANTLGDNTVEYLKATLENHSKKIKISTLGRGLSTGAELEYSDQETLAQALKNRA
jgi:recombination protein RecR